MKKLLVAACIFTVCACSPRRAAVPVGEIPAPKELSITDEQYGHKVLGQLSEKYQLDYDHPRRASVDKIVAKLTKAAKADADPWHVYVFKDSSFKNAAATRGNHVFIWTAMIDATKNDAELAAILAHEIGHVLARHTEPDPDEAVKKMLIDVGAMAAGIAAAQAAGSGQAGELAGRLASSMTDQLGKGVLVYPYSREREYEADQIGLFMMADAGYNPDSAIEFWQRAQGDPALGGGGMAFFSTHPPAGPRLERLRSLLPRANARFKGESLPPAASPNSGASPNRNNAGSAAPQMQRGGAVITGSSSPSNPWDIRSLENAAPKTFLDSGVSQWTVSAPRAILYEKANVKSKAIGEFSRNAFVESVESDGGWVKIEYPDRGYLQKSLLQPAVRR